MSGTILVYGHDPTLLETRRLILEKAGFTVYNTTEFDEFRLLACTHEFDLIILGSSVPSDEVDRILPVIHQCIPFTRVLVITNGDPVPPLSRNDEAFRALEGPKSLISKVNEMLALETVSVRAYRRR
jgi:DNA-binding NtrC family response regulator